MDQINVLKICENYGSLHDLQNFLWYCFIAIIYSVIMLGQYYHTKISTEKVALKMFIHATCNYFYKFIFHDTSNYSFFLSKYGITWVLQFFCIIIIFLVTSLLNNCTENCILWVSPDWTINICIIFINITIYFLILSKFFDTIKK